MDNETLKILETMVDHRMREPIVLKNFLEEYKQVLEADMIPHTEEDIKIAMKLTSESERFENVLEKCSIEHLAQPDDPIIVQFLPGQPEALRVQPLEMPYGAEKLATFMSLKQNQASTTRNPFRRTAEIYKLAPFPTDADFQAASTEPECDYYNDLFLSVRIYRPSRATHIGRDLEKPVFAENFQCLGSNLLTELRDKITCVCNKFHFYDVSDDPEQPLPEKCIDPSFFFIGDTFYNDMRNDANPDYSAVLLKWAKQAKGMRNAKFKRARMEETRFVDLTFSLGFPQLYQHHGNCEHLFTFSQVELLTPSLTFERTLPRSFYPRLHSFGVYNNRLCNMCGNVHYAFIVENSDRQLHDPAYLCSKCFHSFHHIDGKKIGEFKAYRIQDYNDTVTVSNEAREEEVVDADSPTDDRNFSSEVETETEKIIETADETFHVVITQNNDSPTDNDDTNFNSEVETETEKIIDTADETFRVVITQNNVDISVVKEERNVKKEKVVKKEKSTEHKM